MPVGSGDLLGVCGLISNSLTSHSDWNRSLEIVNPLTKHIVGVFGLKGFSKPNKPLFNSVGGKIQSRELGDDIDFDTAKDAQQIVVISAPQILASGL